MMRQSTEQQARQYARQHGYTVRRVPYSRDCPARYIKITHTATGIAFRADGWMDAIVQMIRHGRVVE